MCCFNGKEVILKNQKAYRSFDLTGYTLKSPAWGDRKYHGPTNKTRKPTSTNECGFYAFASQRKMYVHSGQVGAEVELSGPAIQNTSHEAAGWRAQRMRITKIFVDRKRIWSVWSGNMDRFIHALQKRYKCPVVVK